MSDFAHAFNMQYDPQYADAFKKQQENIALREQAQQLAQTFQNAGPDLAGPMPSGEAIPNEQSNFLGNFNPKVVAMMQSGNPELQKRAIALMDVAKPAQATDTQRDYLYAQGQGYDGSYMDYRNAIKNNMSISLDKENASLYGKLPEGHRWVDPNNQELGVEPIPGSSQSKLSSTEAADAAKYARQSENLVRMEELLSSGADVSGMKGIADEYRVTPGLLNSIFDKFLTEGGVGMDDNTIELMSLSAGLQNEVLNLISGAAVSDAEGTRINRQLPVPGQPAAVFRMNMKLTQQNIKSLQEKIARERGINNPNATTSVSLRQSPDANKTVTGAYNKTIPNSNTGPAPGRRWE